MTQIASADITRLAEAMRASGQGSYATTQRVLVESANYLLTEMQARVPVDTGRLRDSLAVRVEGSRVTVGPDTPYAGYVEFGTAPHDIKPKNPEGVLRWRSGGQTYYAKVVHHPGTKAQPFVRDSYNAWVKSLGPMAAQANIDSLKGAYQGA